MALNFGKTLKQVENFGENMRLLGCAKEQALTTAIHVLKNTSEKELKGLSAQALELSDARLIAMPYGNPQDIFSAPPAPENYNAISTDGSQIAPSRHSSFSYYLINIGEVVLSYGQEPAAVLSNTPDLRHMPQDLVLKHPEDRQKDIVVDGEIVNLIRDVQEMCALANLCLGRKESYPILAASDGSLIKWGFFNKRLDHFFTEEFLDRQYVYALNTLQKESDKKELVACGFISKPGSRDVINTLKLAMCDKELPICVRYCGKDNVSEPPCALLDNILDRDLFNALLKEGERSACFDSSSQINDRYGNSRIGFFYMKNNTEICRVEVPKWIIEDRKKLDLLHSLLLDQSARGEGYPICLSEAHEQAVVTNKDKQILEELFANRLARDGIAESPSSSKALSKKSKHL